MEKDKRNNPEIKIKASDFATTAARLLTSVHGIDLPGGRNWRSRLCQPNHSPTGHIRQLMKAIFIMFRFSYLAYLACLAYLAPSSCTKTTSELQHESLYRSIYDLAIIFRIASASKSPSFAGSVECCLEASEVTEVGKRWIVTDWHIFAAEICAAGSTTPSCRRSLSLNCLRHLELWIHPTLRKGKTRSLVGFHP